MSLNMKSLSQVLAKTAAVIEKTVQTTVQEVTGPRPLQDYELLDQVGSGGPGLAWRLYAARPRPSAPSTQYSLVCVWLLDKRALSEARTRAGLSKATEDGFLNVIRADASRLVRIRHPGVVHVVQALDESKNAMAMVTEPLFASVANTLGHMDNVSKVPSELSGMEMGLLEVKHGLLQIAESLDFLHSNARLIHRAISPEVKIQPKLIGNPVCNQSGITISYCRTSQESTPPYSTPVHNCLVKPCPAKQDSSPNCGCAYPFTGTLYFRAPSFSNLKNTTIYGILEGVLEASFQGMQLPVDSVALHNPFFDSNNYLEMDLQVFPSGDVRFSETDIAIIAFTLSNQTFKPPKMFGPYYFIAQHYDHFLVVDLTNKKKNRGPVIIGVAAGLAVLALVLVLLTVVLIRRKKKSMKIEEHSRSYGSTDPTGNSGSAPELKGARWFSFDELKKSTNGFSQASEIGSGSYGKVYRGMLSNGQYVAVKRAQQEALHGGQEFKNEIELLSRFHHRNLVSLVGFSFDQGEQMLVYEYIPNGSLKDSLSGHSGVRLDWKRRLRIALGSAKGLAYLHELANPPTVHRDVKSSNILLDNNLNAKVSDFGLSKALGDGKKSHVTTQVKGTMGYLDPEYYMTQQLTEKSDVYSFGVLLLEIITGKKPIERGRYVVREVKLAMDHNKDLYGLHELLDPALGLGNIVGLEKFVDLALHCVEELGDNRPTMGDVVKELENIMHLAGLNLKSESASTSLSYEGASRSHHPYRNDPFDYSGGPPSSRVEPK